MRRTSYLPKSPPSIWDREDDWPFDAPGHVFVARAARQLLGTDERPSTDQRRDIASTIREHCAWGRLKAAVQERDGSFHLMEPTSWNTNDYRDWCYLGQVPASQAFRWWRAATGNPLFWLFIERESLKAVIEGELKNHSRKVASPVKTYSPASTERWFEARIQKWFDDGAIASDRPTRDELVRDGQTEFEGAPAQRFRDLWDELAPADWKGKGRRPGRDFNGAGKGAKETRE